MDKTTVKIKSISDLQEKFKAFAADVMVDGHMNVTTDWFVKVLVDNHDLDVSELLTKLLNAYYMPLVVVHRHTIAAAVKYSLDQLQTSEINVLNYCDVNFQALTDEETAAELQNAVDVLSTIDDGEYKLIPLDDEDWEIINSALQELQQPQDEQ